MRCIELRRKLVSGVVALLLLAVLFSAVSFAASTDDDIRLTIKKATRLARRGDLEAAEAAFRAALATNPENPDLKVELAFVLLKQRRIREGSELAFAVAKADSTYSRAFSVLGYAYLIIGRFAEAKVLFNNAILLNKKDHLAWAGYGMVDFYENRIQEALNNLEEAVYRGPDEPDYLFALGQAASRGERYDEAAQNYRRFLDVSSLKDKDRRERIKGLISFLEYLGQSPSLYSVTGADSATVPFELTGNRPIIKLRINGRKEELRFVLDTGSAISVMSVATAKRMKVKSVARGGYARGIGGDGKFEIVYGVLNQIDIGGVSIKNVPIYMRPFHTNASTREADGYIGLSLISKFLTTIDYGNSTFALTKKDIDRRDFADNSALSLPLRLTSSGFLSGEVTLEGVERPLNFIVDTGASISVISNEVARTEKVSSFLGGEKLEVIGSAGITPGVPTFLLPRVTFGSNTRRDIQAVALDLDIINETSGFEQAGILGGNFLKHYRLTFDFKNAKVLFSPIVPEKE
ncbi:MAG TPA: aspartyl protease family protein [Pyrinomonadaceae bacterium]|jgi:Flp pilus assembly protein TadD/predicted aspartyl protease|nr:aspartyl protease family protein [Pyrinomonadaceae bacterium]